VLPIMRSLYWPFVGLFLCLWWHGLCEARSSLYYDMVSDYNAGKNYFSMLGVSRDASEVEIQKAFRKLAIANHPDKVGKKGEQAYHDLVRAKEALVDPEARKEYESLLAEGVPWQEQYYGKYAHKYGAPDADVRYVLLGLVSVISVAQYVYKYHRHLRAIELIKNSKRYKQALKVKQFEEGKNQKKKKKKESSSDEEEQEDDGPAFSMFGREKPKIIDLFGVTLLLSPIYIARALFYGFRFLYVHVILREPYVIPDQEEVMREKLGMTKEEWEVEKQKAVERRQRFLQSDRYRRYKRMMNKNG